MSLPFCFFYLLYVNVILSCYLEIKFQAVQQLQANKANASASAQQINHSTMDIFQIETATEFFRYLVTNLDTEGRYLFLNAIANQLRYPNSHTHYFSFIILYLFAEATQVFFSFFFFLFGAKREGI